MKVNDICLLAIAAALLTGAYVDSRQNLALHDLAAQKCECTCRCQAPKPQPKPGIGEPEPLTEAEFKKLQDELRALKQKHGEGLGP